MLKNVRLAIAVGVAFAALTVPIISHADNIVTNTWYAGHFYGPDTPLLAAGAATNGPVLPSGTAAALPAPGPSSSSPFSATITLPSGGYLLVTDVETSGDQFAMSVNGSPAALTPAGASGLVPGGAASYNGLAVDGGTYSGLTSYPLANAASGADISGGLSNPDYSSGTFLLPAGVDTITGEFLGTINYGDMAFIVEPAAAVPEPTTMLLLGFGLLGLAGYGRKKFFKK